MKIRFFNNGNVMAFDSRGEQVVEIQRQSWVTLYFHWLISQGYNLDEIEFMMPDGTPVEVHTDGPELNWTMLR